MPNSVLTALIVNLTGRVDMVPTSVQHVMRSHRLYVWYVHDFMFTVQLTVTATYQTVLNSISFACFLFYFYFDVVAALYYRMNSCTCCYKVFTWCSDRCKRYLHLLVFGGRTSFALHTAYVSSSYAAEHDVLTYKIYALVKAV